VEDYSGCTSLAFSNSGRVLFTSYKNEVIRSWDIFTEREAGTKFGESSHTKDILALSLSDDGKTLISAGKDGKIFGWELNSK